QKTAVPEADRLVPEDEPDEHLDVRHLPNDGKRLLEIGRLLRGRDALGLARLGLESVFGDPDRHAELETSAQVVRVLRGLDEVDVRVTHLLSRPLTEVGVRVMGPGVELDLRPRLREELGEQRGRQRLLSAARVERLRAAAGGSLADRDLRALVA